MVVVDECLAGDTKVLLANGHYEEIQNIIAGQEIISYNVNENRFESDIVIKTHRNLIKSSNEKMYRLTFEDNTTIDVTGNHMILTDIGYVRADMLNETHDIISY
jgi:intein/homing endonuclease